MEGDKVQIITTTHSAILIPFSVPHPINALPLRRSLFPVQWETLLAVPSSYVCHALSEVPPEQDGYTKQLPGNWTHTLCCLDSAESKKGLVAPSVFCST